MSTDHHYVTAMPLPPGTAIDPALARWAVRDEDGMRVDDGNEILRFLSAAPEHAADVLQVHFDRWLSSPLGPRLTELLRLAVARQTGCPVCQAVRRPGARRAGVDAALVAAIGDPLSPVFTDRERLAIAYASALAGDHQQVTEQTYAELLAQGRILETLTRGSVCPIQP